jgi:O-antigen/teichoic acid export membrane protein
MFALGGVAATETLTLAVAAAIGLNAFLYSYIGLEVGRLRGLGKPIFGQAVDSLLSPVVTLAYASIAYASDSLDLALLMAAATLGSTLTAAILRRSAQERAAGVSGVEWTSIRRVATQILSGQVATALSVKLPVPLISILVGLAAAGIFEIAQRVQTMTTLVAWAASVSVAPLLAHSYVARDRAGVRRLMLWASMVSVIPPIVALIGLALFGDVVLGVLGTDYTGVLPVAIILTAAAVIDTGAGPVGTLCNMTGRQRLVRNLGAAQLFLLVSLTVILVPVGGLEGGAWAVFIGVVVRNVGLLWATREDLTRARNRTEAPSSLEAAP